MVYRLSLKQPTTGTAIFGTVAELVDAGRLVAWKSPEYPVLQVQILSVQ